MGQAKGYSIQDLHGAGHNGDSMAQTTYDAHYGGGQLPSSANAEGGQRITAGKTPAPPAKPGMTEAQNNNIIEKQARMPEQAHDYKAGLAQSGVDTSFVQGHQSPIVAPDAPGPSFGERVSETLKTVGGAVSGAVKHVAGGDSRTGTTLTPADKARLHAKDSTLY